MWRVLSRKKRKNISTKVLPSEVSCFPTQNQLFLRNRSSARLHSAIIYRLLNKNNAETTAEQKFLLQKSINLQK